MKKRILAAVLWAALLLSLLPAASAKAEDVPEREKAVVLRELEIMVGDPSGDLLLDRKVTRAEFTKLAVCASPYKDSVGAAAATDPYPDVSHRDWFAPYVRAAVDMGMVQGDLEGYFRPLRTITLQEGVTIAVRLLGYTDGDFSAPWPAGQMALYRSLELDAGVAAARDTDELTRRDCLHLFYNLLTVPNRSGTPYINLLGHTLNQKKEVDVAALFQVEQEGPIPLTGDWRSLLPFGPEDALIYRDSSRAALEDLREWDLLYWAKDQAILFAVSDGSSAMNQMNAAVEGPLVAEGSWEDRLPFPLDQAASVVRNGCAAQTADIRPGDVVYWSKYAKGLYVYTKTVQGTVEGVSPSLAAPTAVTVAGQRYSLETFETQFSLSDLGSVRKGDRVRLLLGRTGGVAAIRPLEEDPEPVVGVITAAGDRTYTDRDDNSYTAAALTLTAADGSSYTYPWDGDDLEPGDLAAVTLIGGEAVFTKLPARPLTGWVDLEDNTLGDLTLAPDLVVLDTYGAGQTLSVPPSRIHGVSLTDHMVRYYTTDDQDRVDSLILRDVTGDLHTYGVLTDVTAVNVNMALVGIVLQTTYTLDVGGTARTASVTGKAFPVDNGPALLCTDGMEAALVKNLRELPGVVLGERSVSLGGRRYTLADRTLYYIYHPKDGTYTSSSRAQVLEGEYPLSAWYDATDREGGRVRIIVAHGPQE